MTNNNDDESSIMFEMLNEQSALVAEILSFVIEDTRQLAILRTVSKAWNKAVIPHCLEGRRFLKTCASPKHDFLEELVTFGESSYAGRVYPLSPAVQPFQFFMDTTTITTVDESGEAWLRSIKMTFLRNYEYRRPDDLFEVPKQENYSFLEKDAEKFSRYCSTLQNTESWGEFQATAEKAYNEAFFLSVEDLEKVKSEGAKMDLQKERGSRYLPMIVTVQIPVDMYTPIQAGSATIVLLKARLNKVDIVPKYGSGIDPSNHPFLEFRDLPSIAKADDESHVYPTYAGYNPVPNDDGTVSCQVPLAFHLRDGLQDLLWDLDSADSYLPLEDLLRKCQEQPVREGVAIADGLVSDNLTKNLMKQIDDFNQTQKIVDYHPHSNNIVRDIVHPALYSYVKGVSPLLKTEQEIAALSQDPNVAPEDRVELQARDYWGRFYEASAKYQWLPTYFSIGQDGSCTICDYINNLVPRNSETEALYGSLAQLFSQALPLIESVYGYCRVIKEEQYIRMDDDSEMSYDDDPPQPIDEKPVSLRGKEVQVVTKIVDYELGPGETYEGVWHVEGMSHEEIVATAIYFIDRNEEIEGGDIYFKRAFHKQEAMFIFSSVDQVRPREMEDIIDEGLMPLGTVETRKGRLVVFPNSHVHKVSQITNTATDGGKKKRRIVVFFLINPERRIVSTREVPVQQEHAGGTMKREEALEHRLALMKERKFTKQDWNVRDIELCEH